MRPNDTQRFTILDDLRLIPLPAERAIARVYVHCSASKWGDAEIIDEWHKDRTYVDSRGRTRNWSGIGYHFVVNNGFKHPKRPTVGFPRGIIQMGRSINKAGAQVEGDNSYTIGICMILDGDKENLMSSPYDPLVRSTGLLVATLCRELSLPSKAVLGHREAGRVEGVQNPRKSCPGSLINCDVMRAYVQYHIDNWEDSIRWFDNYMAQVKSEYPNYDYLSHPKA